MDEVERSSSSWSSLSAGGLQESGRLEPGAKRRLFGLRSTGAVETLEPWPSPWNTAIATTSFIVSYLRIHLLVP